MFECGTNHSGQHLFVWMDGLNCFGDWASSTIIVDSAQREAMPEL
jgi:hypothetical protein